MLYGGVSRALAETRPAEAAYVRGLQSRHAGREGPLTAGTEQAVSCARSVPQVLWPPYNAGKGPAGEKA